MSSPSRSSVVSSGTSTTARTPIPAAYAGTSTSHSSVGSAVFKILQTLMEVDKPLDEHELMRLTAIFVPSNPDLEAQLRRNPRIAYDPQQRTYSFKAKHNIHSKDDIVALLETIPGGASMDVRELQESWRGATKAVEELSTEGRVVVLRSRDNKPRFVYPSDASLVVNVSEEFKRAWHLIHVPKENDLYRELEKAGLKAASGAPRPTKQEQTTKLKKVKKKVHKRIKITNTHLVGLDLTQEIN